MWERLVGQEQAVVALQRAVLRPTHAYLLVGPPGSGVDVAARCLAAALLGGDDDVAGRVLRGVHPDVVEIEPEGTFFLTAQAETVIREVYASPVDGPRKIVVLLEAERMNDEAANRLLKTLEEPPPNAVVVLVAGNAEMLPATVRSRCQRIELRAVPDAVVAGALVADGIDPERAGVVAGLAAGDLGRARLLAGGLARVRDVAVRVPARLDGTGAQAALLAEEVEAVVHDAVAETRATQREEEVALENEHRERGYPDRVARAATNRLRTRHKRQDRRGRVEALREAVTAIETVYLDALVGAAIRNPDREPPVLATDAVIAALDACREARVALASNPNETLLLEWLLLALPAGTPPLPARANTAR